MQISKLIAILIFSASTYAVRGQSLLETYVQANTHPIFTIELDNSDFSDLEAIGAAIDSSRIVMLGEQDHGDAPGYFAKVRLIKYLHEKKGFNVLAFENDFFNTNYGWQLFKEGKTDIASFIKYKVSINWSVCGKESPFFEGYLLSTLKTNSPIEITGFDNRTATPQTLPVLDSVLRNLQIPLTEPSEYEVSVLPLLKSWYTHTDDSVAMNKIIDYYSIIRSQLLQKLPQDNFWIITVENLISQMRQYKDINKDQWQNYRDRNIRDKQMAVNLRWLSQVKYATQKIIVWTHNYHVSKYAGHYPESYLKDAMTMGTYFTNDSSLLKQTYIVGFTSYSGTAGRFNSKPYKTQKARSDGFESWINNGYKYAFVDFQKFNNLNRGYHKPFYMKCAMTSPFHRNARAEWNKIFDGVFYIKHTYSCDE
jgi:erythromycin esterase